jgi:hypothetical protein
MLKPDLAQVASINEEIERRLMVALDHLVGDVLKAQQQACWGVTPAVHALQSLMREAAIAGNVDQIRSLYQRHKEVLVASSGAGQACVVAWTEAYLSTSERVLLQAAFQDDIGLTSHLQAPAPEVVAQMRGRISRVSEAMHRIMPVWAQEFEALVALIVLAETEAGTFAGASAFPAWGAILVNPRSQVTDLDLVVTLIHESSHLKMFSAYLDDEIVLNDPNEVYSSPLRREARPMNGIYHAAFVLARMVSFMHNLRETGQAGAVIGTDLTVLDARIKSAVQGFEAAYDVIATQGQLTSLGRMIIEEAAAGVAAVKMVHASA